MAVTNPYIKFHEQGQIRMIWNPGGWQTHQAQVRIVAWISSSTRINADMQLTAQLSTTRAVLALVYNMIPYQRHLLNRYYPTQWIVWIICILGRISAGTSESIHAAVQETREVTHIVTSPPPNYLKISYQCTPILILCGFRSHSIEFHIWTILVFLDLNCSKLKPNCPRNFNVSVLHITGNQSILPR